MVNTTSYLLFSLVNILFISCCFCDKKAHFLCKKYILYVIPLFLRILERLFFIYFHDSEVIQRIYIRLIIYVQPMNICLKKYLLIIRYESLSITFFIMFFYPTFFSWISSMSVPETSSVACLQNISPKNISMTTTYQISL